MGHGKHDSLLPITIGHMSERELKIINPNVQFNEYFTDHSTTKQVFLLNINKHFYNIKKVLFLKKIVLIFAW